MRTVRNARLAGIVLTALLAPFVLAQSSNVSVFASGFNNPRGLKFGPDGALYVAEGGTGGSQSTIGMCKQVPDLGPYTGGFTGRISKVAHNGAVSTVADHLPSSMTSAATGNLTSSVADVAFLHGVLYAVTAGSGCSHGLAGTNNAVLRINSDGSRTQVTNLSTFVKNHPVVNPNPGDFEPDGTWYSMIAVDDLLYAVEANHGELDAIALNGTVRRVADISNVEGHIVPTAVAFHNGAFYVGNLERFPIQGETSKVLKIWPNGAMTTAYINFSTITGLAFDAKGRLYVLENTTGNLGPTPGTGKILRIDGKNNYKTIASGLSLPTAMTFGPDGNIYVSVLGFGAPAGAGQVVKVVVP